MGSYTDNRGHPRKQMGMGIALAVAQRLHSLRGILTERGRECQRYLSLLCDLARRDLVDVLSRLTDEQLGVEVSEI